MKFSSIMYSLYTFSSIGNSTFSVVLQEKKERRFATNVILERNNVSLHCLVLMP